MGRSVVPKISAMSSIKFVTLVHFYLSMLKPKELVPIGENCISYVRPVINSLHCYLYLLHYLR